MASTVTPFTDMDPSPRVNVDIDAADLDVATVRITVHQISKAGDIEVRNMVRRSSLGGFFETDYEPPFGVPITYKVQQYDVDDVELGYVLELTTQVNVAPGKAVLSDPLAPKTAVMVDALEDFGGDLRRPRDMRTYDAGLRKVALMGLQSLLANVSLHCETETLEDADRLVAVLAAGQFLVRIAPPTRMPLLLHVVCDDPRERPINVQFGGGLIEWVMFGDEVTRASIDILVPVITYQRFIDYMAAQPVNSYAAAAAIWSTYLDAVRNPPPEA